MSETLQVDASNLGDGACELSFTGQLESKGAEFFGAVCQEQLERGVRHLIVDLSRVSVISSSGIGALMVIQEDFQDQGGRVSYVSLSKEVHSVVRLMDLEAILNIAESKEEALQTQ